MGKVRDISQRINGRKQLTPQGEPILHRNIAETLVETQILLFILSAQEVLVEDFNFDADQLKKFNELWFARTELNRLHRKV